MNSSALSSSPALLDDVAVLLPVFSKQPHIAQIHVARTLSSFAEDAQVHVLIVDDGNTPPFAPPTLPNLHIEILRLPHNVGIELALKAGIEKLAEQGYRYAARIDAGDLTVPHRLKKQRAYLQAHPNIAGVGKCAQAVSSKGQPLFKVNTPAEPSAVRRLRFFRTTLLHPAMMLRIEAVLAVGNYRNRYRAAEDLDLFLRLMERYDCANLPELGLYYEINETGISITKRRRQLLSTLQLQLRYFNAANIYDWLGFVKHMLHFCIPSHTVQQLKRLFFN